MRAFWLFALLVSATSWAGSVQKEPVTVVAVRDDELWMLTYAGATPWAPGQEFFLAIPVADGKPSPIGAFVVQYDRGQNRFQVKLQKKMGAFRRGRAGERLVAVFKSGEARDPAAVEESSTDEAERPKKPVKGSARMAKRFGVSVGLGEPVGTFAALGLHYNLVDFLTVSGHFGLQPFSAVRTTGFSGGLRLYVPNWNLTPFLHPSVALLKIRVDISRVVGDVKFHGSVVDDGQSYFFFNVPFGVSWHTKTGFAVEVFGNLLKLSTFPNVSGLAFGGHLAIYF